MSTFPRTRLRLPASVVLLSAWLGCATSRDLPEVIPSCKTQLAPGDTGLLSYPCPGVAGVSSPCNGSPSQIPLLDCEIDDGPVGHFHTVCVETCPDAGTER